MRLLPICDPSHCHPGTMAIGLYGEDGQWYDCEVQEVGSRSLRVRYTEYNNEEEIPFDRIRLKRGDDAEAAAKEKKRKAKEILTPAGYRIPQTLQISTADSEHVKKQKKKKIQLLKKQQRNDQVEEEARGRASAWQHHTQKAKTKRLISRNLTSMTLTGLRQQTNASIFKTSDLPEGKVGVTNSGRGMTTFTNRAKHVFADDEDA
eukprot:GHVU01191357.1.p1 GENE.GHVU01191357.1~~GHVU01191357.1.p1  ORF type:complete len:205 (+),score=48.27 GHVU01191357.1:268-882(+)